MSANAGMTIDGCLPRARWGENTDLVGVHSKATPGRAPSGAAVRVSAVGGDTPEAWPAQQLDCLIGGVSPTARVLQLRLIPDRRLRFVDLTSLRRPPESVHVHHMQWLDQH